MQRLEGVNVEYHHGRTVTTDTRACHSEVDANNNLGFPCCHDIVLFVKTMLISTLPSSNATTVTQARLLRQTRMSRVIEANQPGS